MGSPELRMISAREALERLARRQPALRRRSPARRAASARRAATSSPSGRSRSRSCSAAPTRACPAEIVFDQGLGDLFVIRVAGNIVAPSQIGSVEFAAERFGTRLVVVLGHSGCGAILATLEQLKRPVEKQSRNLRSIVDRVRPSVEALLATPLRDDPEALMRDAVRANVRASASNLRHGSEILEQLIDERRAARRRRRVLARDGRRGVLRGAPGRALAAHEQLAALVLQLSKRRIVDGSCMQMRERVAPSPGLRAQSALRRSRS